MWGKRLGEPVQEGLGGKGESIRLSIEERMKKGWGIIYNGSGSRT